MTAELLEFPAGYQAPARQLDAPCQILILPVVKIEHEDSIRAQRRRAYFAMKEALRGTETIPLPTPMQMETNQLARHFGIRPEDVHFS